jgi:hypothetical protein
VTFKQKYKMMGSPVKCISGSVAHVIIISNKLSFN